MRPGARCATALLLGAICLAAGSAAVSAQVVEPESVEEAVHLTRAPVAAPMRLAEEASLAPLATLGMARDTEAPKLQELADWNLSGGSPARNGFERPLSSPHEISLDPGLLTPGRRPQHLAGGLAVLEPSGQMIWGAKVRVEGAYRIRLQLVRVELPSDSRVWVYADSGEAAAPVGLELLSDDDVLLTPSVGGPLIHIEVLVPQPAPDQTTGFTIDAVIELFQLDASGQPILDRSVEPRATDCLLDAECVDAGDFDVIDLVQRSIAHLQFVAGGSAYICTGGLLNDTDDTTVVPYLLTANHCFSTQSVTSTLEAYWDYYADGCLGPWPSLGSLPRSLGGTLLATGSSSDFTFLRLSSIPANRVLLGWSADPDAVDSPTPVHRVSHPFGWAQAYSQTTAYSPGATCSGVPPSRYIYSMPVLGGTAGGSSGAPVLLAGGYTVGQLLGACGLDPSNPCSDLNDQVDGRFSTTYPSISEYLDPQVTTYTLNVSKGGTGSGTVTSNPGAIDCGDTCSDEFTEGTVVTLTATAAAGSVFAGWTGQSDCSDGQVTMSGNRSCTATFNLTYRTLSVSKIGSGAGTVTSDPPGILCGGDCSESYLLGTVVGLTATPAADSSFAGWGGSGDCGDGTVTMSGDRSCSATFELLPTYLLSVSRVGTGAGEVTSIPSGVDCGGDCEEEYPEGTGVRLVGTPETGSELTSWTGHADCSDGHLAMTGDRSCTATFNTCATQSELTFESTDVAGGSQVVSACNYVHVGPGVRVLGTGLLEVYAGNGVGLYDGVEVWPGGEMKVVVGQPMP